MVQYAEFYRWALELSREGFQDLSCRTNIVLADNNRRLAGQILPRSGNPTSVAALRKKVFLTTLHCAPAPARRFRSSANCSTFIPVYSVTIRNGDAFNRADKSSTIVVFSGLIFAPPIGYK